MEQNTLQNQLAQLAEKWNLTQSEIEQEPYTLTQKEEQEAIRNAVESEKKKLRDKVTAKVFVGEIEAKIKNIDWGKAIDRNEILTTANKNKNRIIWERQQRILEREERIKKLSELKKRCDANYFFNLMKRICINSGKQFEQDEYNRDLIKIICFFLSRDERFETELSFDGNKGLLIRGISGLGKTFLFECVKNNELNPIKIISMIEVVEEVKGEGSYNFSLNNEKIIYLDDVGTEEATVNHFGTKINWFKEFIEKQYQNKNNFKNIVISTNCNFLEIEQKYDFRVRSRMKEMFNVVNVTGKDRRN